MSRLERLYSPPEINAPGKREARGRRRDLLLAGLFVLAMAALAVLALALLSPGMLGGAYRLHAYFNNADGLNPGLHVIEAGYTIGTLVSVTPVFPERDGDEAKQCLGPVANQTRRPGMPCFKATLRILNDWPIPDDSTAQLGASGLLAGKAIKIHAGGAPTRLGPGSVIETRGRERDLLAQLEELTTTIQNLVDQTIAPALASIQQQIDTIGGLLGTGAGGEGLGGESRQRIAGVFENLQELSAEIKQIIDPEQIRGILSAVQQVSDNLAEVSATLPSRSTDVQGAVQRFSDLADELRALVEQSQPSVQGSLDDVQYVLQELSATLAPILANIENASRNLSALSRDLRNNPASLLRGRAQEDQSPWFDQ